jgi:hypothetical protein
MKKLLMLLVATASFTFAAPAWTPPALVKEIWIVPGTTPVVRIMLDDGAPNPYYAFYLNESTKETLNAAKDALNNNLSVKLYADKSLAPVFLTGLAAPNVSQVSAVYPMYTLAFGR